MLHVRMEGGICLLQPTVSCGGGSARLRCFRGV